MASAEALQKCTLPENFQKKIIMGYVPEIFQKIICLRLTGRHKKRWDTT